MTQETFSIHNRQGQTIAVVVDRPEPSRGLAFVMHGLGGNKESPPIASLAEGFVESHYTTVRFDTTNTFGESDGRYEEATLTNYYCDLEDVIAWASGQPWYQEPFVLCGHSFGGICTALFAQKHPEKLKGLAPIATVVSGQLSIEARTPEEIEQWKTTGWHERPGRSKPERLPWSHMEDRLDYDLLPDASRLTMPVILMVGSEDSLTPVAHQAKLFELLPGRKEFHIIRGAPHVFRESAHLSQIKTLLQRWISTL
jgi:pimeloyl-ACP methyl ester carboxylesterase